MSSLMTDVSSERAVLAGICRHGRDVYLDVADILSPDTFSLDSNQVIYQCVHHTYESEDAPEKIDFPTLLSAAKTLGVDNFLDSETERKHLRAVLNTPVNPETVRRLAAKVRKLEIARLAYQKLAEVRSDIERVSGDESIGEILSRVDGPVLDFTSLYHGNGLPASAKRLGHKAVEYFTHLMDNPRERIGISTGFPLYDEFIGGGIRPNSVDVIVARSKSGKSHLADVICLHIAGNSGIPVLNVDLEMSEEEHLHRVGANLAGIPSRDIEKGIPGRDSLLRSRLLEAGRRLADMPYDYLCAAGWPFEQVIAGMRRWLCKTVGLAENGKAKPCAIILDWLKLTSGSILKNMAEHQALGFQTTALKNFCNRYGVGCLTMAQANREGLDAENEATIASSDRITWFATSITIYKWLSDVEKAQFVGHGKKFTHKMVHVLTRHGAKLSDDDYVLFETDYAHSRIKEGPTKDSLLNAGEVTRLDRPKGFTVDTNTLPFGNNEV